MRKIQIGNHLLKSPTLFASYRLGDCPTSGLRHLPWSITATEAILINAFDLTRRKFNKLLNSGWNPGNSLDFRSGPLLIDSGAYYFRKHPDISVTPQQILNLEIKSGADAGVVLDHPFPPDAKDKARRITTTLRNTETMLKALNKTTVKTDMTLWPVIHGHTPKSIQNCIERLKRLAEKHNPALLNHVGIGSLAPLAQCGKTTLAVDVIHQVRRSLPQSHIHCFSMGSALNMLLAFSSGADSVDSQTWMVSAGFKLAQLPGHYVMRMGRREYGDDRKFLDAMKNFSDRLARLANEEGFFVKNWTTGDNLDLTIPANRSHYVQNLVDLNTNENVHNRACHNLWSYNFEVRRCRAAASQGKLNEFLKSRLSNTRYASALERSLSLSAAR